MNEIARPDRPLDDHYITPAEATRALLSVEKFGGDIWECCAGTGEMAAVLRSDGGYRVYATTVGAGRYDLSRFQVIGEQDVFAWNSCAEANVVTNPPYGKPDRDIAERVVRHILSLKPVKACFLLNIKFLGGTGRMNGLYADWKPARIHVFADRVTMYPAGWTGKMGTTTETFAWFVWDSSSKHAPPQIGWLEAGKFKVAR